MARIEGMPANKAGLFARFVYRSALRRYGKKIPESLTILAHHPWVLAGQRAFSMAMDRSHRVEDRIKVLAQIKVATLVGCGF